MARVKHVPVGLGYRMPAEWEPHAATWLAWPHEKTDCLEIRADSVGLRGYCAAPVAGGTRADTRCGRGPRAVRSPHAEKGRRESLGGGFLSRFLPIADGFGISGQFL